MTTSLSNIKVTDGTNNMVIKADDITLNGTSVLVDSATWGNIDGTLSDQTDLQTALDTKANDANVVHKTGNETIAGTKTFTSAIQRTASLNGGGTALFNLTDTNGKGSVNQSSYYVSETLYNRLNTVNATSNKEGYIEIQNKDDGTFRASINGNGTNLSLTRAVNGTTDTEMPTKGWVNNPATSTNVVHRSGDEIINGNKTFHNDLPPTLDATENKENNIIGASKNTAGKIDGMSISRFVKYNANGNNKRYVSYRAGFTNAAGTTNLWPTLDLGVDENEAKFAQFETSYVLAPTPSEDTTSSTQIDTVGARNTKLQNYLQQADQGNLLPNFDTMTVLETKEFDTSDSDYHVICTRTNTDSSDAELNDILYFRITVTGTSINQVGNYVVILPGRINNQPFVIANMFPGTTSSTYGGCRYLAYVYPKALNSGYGWEICVRNDRNTSARHYKVEVFKTNSKITWTTGTATTFDSTYQGRGTIDVETRYGYIFNYMYGAVLTADNASQINSRLQKFINCTINTAGAALLANQFVYQNGNSLYPGTDKTKAIEPGFGIQLCNTAYSSGNSVGWDQLRQKVSITSLTNIPHATLARGNPCYFRCTMDANDNILSDNYVATSMANGYTWYYVGIAQSTTAIALDTTQSFFMTLDSNGKLTHVNGKPIINTDTKNTAGSTDTSSKIFLVGATSQAANPQTYSHDTAFVDTNGRLNSAAPASNANDTTVATTKWVKDQGYSSGGQATWGSVTGTLSNQTDLQTALNAKAADSDVVKLTGNQTIAGTKTFSASPVLPTPTTTDDSTKAATTAYVKANLSSYATNTDMTAATADTAGTHGLVPAPAAGKQAQFLRGDGTWQTPTNTKNTAGSTDTSSKIFLVGATSQAASPQTYSHDTAFVDANGRINSAAPATDANDTTVATTKWVKDQSYITSSGSITGSAAKLTTKRTIDGVEFDGSANITHYGTCSTDAATAAKTVDCTGFKLATGSLIFVRFTVTNTAKPVTLEVNGTGAKTLKYRNADFTAGYLAANRTYAIIYDGTYYQIVGDFDNNNDTYDRVKVSNNVKAASAITANKLIVGTSVGYKNAASAVTFDLSYPILIASSAIDAAATGTNNYRFLNSRSVRDITGNSSWAGTQYATLYLVLSAINGVTATIDSTFVTTTVPNTADGKFYIPLGIMYSTYQFYFCPQDKIYAYTNGKFQEYGASGGGSGDYVSKSECSEVQCIVETWHSGTYWYRIWSDGWIETGMTETVGNSTSKTCTFAHTFSDTNYVIECTQTGDSTSYNNTMSVVKTSASQFTVNNANGGSTNTFYIYACGY